MKLEVRISKNNIFVLIAIVLILTSIFVVYAYNPSFLGGNPSVVGHSPDEIIVNINGVPKSLQAAISDGSINGPAPSGCSANYVDIGGSCKNVPTCSNNQALKYISPSGFTCVNLPSETPQPTVYRWKKLCDSSSVTPSCSSNNCDSWKTIGDGQGNIRVCTNLYGGAGTTSNAFTISSCFENAECLVPDQFCIKGFQTPSATYSGTCCGIDSPKYMGGTGGQIYRCLSA